MLETKRLLIRNFEKEDTQSCFMGWGRDKNLGKYIIGYPVEEKQMATFVSAWTENKNAWVIVEKESKNCIGYVTIDIPYLQLGIGEIGYVIGERYQHKGYAYEALNCILQEYLVHREMYMLEAKYNVSNIASGNLLKKLGFRVDGELRNRRIDFASGQRKNLVICSITKGEKMITYKVLSADDVELSLFASFDRTQKVTKCWRKINGEWLIKDVPFVDNWSEEEYREGVQYLKNLIHSGGYVVGAFSNGQLKGFASVEPALFGTHAKYLELSNIHVSQDMRGQGIGKELFRFAKKWAKEHHAEKLYISAHSAIESQAFYRAMGCVEAVEYNKELAEKEPCDCQLECVL